MRAAVKVCMAGILWGAILLGVSCGGDMKKRENEPAAERTVEKEVIPAQLAGSWYAANRAKLADELQQYMAEAADVPVIPNVMALISPHAGFRFSGPVAAQGLHHIAGKTFSRVIVMGPSHRVHMPNFVSIPSATHYATPLGEIPLDTAFIQRLRNSPLIRDVPQAVAGENSVEIQLPMLQTALGSFRLVPVYVGQLDLDTATALAKVFLQEMDAETLVVASSDFTHYGPNYQYVPFSENIPENLKKLDMGAVDEIQKKSARGFVDYCRKTGATVCGHDPIAILLNMLPPEAQFHLLKYDISGNMVGDFNNSVSYISMAFSGRWPAAKPERAEAQASVLSAEDRKSLLGLARGTLDFFFQHGKKPSPRDLGITITPGMKSVMGAFVTLHKQGDLRGCIGEIFPRRALYEAVMDHAMNSAFNDTRFPQVAQKELAEIEIEISALTPPQPVASYKDIEIGRHGMVLSKQGRSAVFLPQVAPEQGWDLATTLTHLSMKAGLPPTAWKEGAQFTVFEAIVFSEEIQ